MIVVLHFNMFAKHGPVNNEEYENFRYLILSTLELTTLEIVTLKTVSLEIFTLEIRTHVLLSTQDIAS